MKTFLHTVFHFSVFQVAVLVVCAGLKYLVEVNELSVYLKWPFIWTIAILSVLMVMGVGIGGMIEDKGMSVEEWAIKGKGNKYSNLLLWLIKIATVAPALLYFIIWGAAIVEGPFDFLLCCLAGILIRNTYTYFKERYRGGTTEVQSVD